MLDAISDKMWAVVAAIISALGGYVMYERKKIDHRLSKLEEEISEHKTELAVVKECLTNLKEDTQEIKEFQKATVDILTAMNMKKRKI